MATYLSGFFVPQVLPLGLTALFFSTAPPIILWRRNQAAGTSQSQVSPGRGREVVFLSAVSAWGVLYLVYLGGFDQAFSQVPTWDLTMLLVIFGLAVADLIALAKGSALWVALTSVFCLGLSLALFSALPSVQLSAEYANGIASAGFPLPWYSASIPYTFRCSPPNCLHHLRVFVYPSNPVHLDYLLFDAFLYASMAAVLFEVSRATRIRLKANLPKAPSQPVGSFADSLSGEPQKSRL